MLNSSKLAVKQEQFIEKRKRMLQVIKSFLETDDQHLIREISNQMDGNKAQKRCKSLSKEEEELVFKRIMAHTELNFYQKIELLNSLNLEVNPSEEQLEAYNKYLNENVNLVNRSGKHLMSMTNSLNDSKRYTVNRKLYNYFNRNPLVKQGKGEKSVLPVKKLAQIRHVAFGTGEYAHLVVVCTEKRLLIWNLLTLRLQTAIKLSVRTLTVDPYTSLVAAFTENNERK